MISADRAVLPTVLVLFVHHVCSCTVVDWFGSVPGWASCRAIGRRSSHHCSCGRRCAVSTRRGMSSRPVILAGHPAYRCTRRPPSPFRPPRSGTRRSGPPAEWPGCDRNGEGFPPCWRCPRIACRTSSRSPLGARHGVGNDPTYNISTCFETSLSPGRRAKNPRPCVQAIAQATRALVSCRDAWLNPGGASAAELKQRTLTKPLQRPS
jgi:hypothetical protein